MELPTKAKQALSLQIAFINAGLAEYGGPDDLSVMFDCEEADFHAYEILQDSANQYALGFIEAMAVVKGVEPATLISKPKPKPTPKPKARKKKGERKTDGPDAVVIQLHRGGKG
jgi:hypothetical protein